MNGFDLVRSEVLVENLFESVGISGGIVTHQSQSLAHLPPHELLVRHLVVAAMGDNVLEELEQIYGDVAHFGLRVEVSSALLVEGAQFLDELLILGSAVDRMLDGGFGSRSHVWRWRARLGAQDEGRTAAETVVANDMWEGASGRGWSLGGRKDSEEGGCAT